MSVRMRKILKTLASLTPGNNLRISLLRRCGYHIGSKVYVGQGLIIADELEDTGHDVIIGDRVSIGPRVTIVTTSAPNDSRLKGIFGKTKGHVKIMDDAWIGTGAIILPGVTIGHMSVVGAGAVVTEDVPPKSMVVGVPAKVVRRIEGSDAT